MALKTMPPGTRRQDHGRAASYLLALGPNLKVQSVRHVASRGVALCHGDKERQVKKILSIDGGGICGVVPAVVLTEVERRIQRRVAEMFGLIAGTSTGGILALGLSAAGENGKPKYDAARLLKLYERVGAAVSVARLGPEGLDLPVVCTSI